MDIRRAMPADAPGIARVLVASYRDAHRGQLPAAYLRTFTEAEARRGWTRTLARVAEASARERVFVAFEGERHIGVAMAGPFRRVLGAGGDGVDEVDGGEGESGDFGAPPGVLDPESTVGELYLVYLLPDVQRRSLGRALVGVSAAWLLTCELDAMRVRVLRANVPAQRFYAALGGRPTGSERYVDDAVVLDQLLYDYDAAALASLAAAAPTLTATPDAPAHPFRSRWSLRPRWGG